MATSLKIDDDLKARVKRLAARRERSAHWIMHEAIRNFVDREEARDDFVAEAVASWAAYRETGRHLSGDEAQSWLNTWGTPDETSAPPCHD